MNTGEPVLSLIEMATTAIIGENNMIHKELITISMIRLK
jgi:hypothetical protein